MDTKLNRKNEQNIKYQLTKKENPRRNKKQCKIVVKGHSG